MATPFGWQNPISAPPGSIQRNGLVAKQARFNSIALGFAKLFAWVRHDTLHVDRSDGRWRDLGWAPWSASRGRKRVARRCKGCARYSPAYWPAFARLTCEVRTMKCPP